MRDHWPLTGRKDEVAEINRLFAVDGLRGVVLAGKPGVGKSRLAREAVLAAAGAGWSVRSIVATATSQAIPLGAFARWTDDAGGAPHALARRVVDALTVDGELGRLVVFVDDAHLLDDLSALVVHQLVESHTATVILTLRTGEPAPDAVTALWQSGALRRRDVEPLTRHDTDRLLAAAFGATPDEQCGDAVWRLTAGNALFLRELVDQEVTAGRMVVTQGHLRWLGSVAISGSLAELVDAQIGAIPVEVRDVVDLVAVSEPADWHCVRLIADQIAVEHAEQLGLIRTAGDEVFIGHPMYAEVRLSRCGSARLRRLRGQVATAMKDGGSPAKVMKRGLLWLESDLPSDTDVLLSAAQAAISLLDFETAERLFTAATDTGIGPEARVSLAFSLFMSQKGDRVLEVLDDVEADEATRSAFINEVVVRASNLLWPMRSPERSWRLVDEALKTARGAHRQQLLVFRANQLAMAARPLEVLATMAEVAYDDLDDYGAAMGYGAESMACGELGRTDRSAEMAVAAGRVLKTSDQGKFLRQPVTEFHTFALTAAGRIAEAVEIGERNFRAQRDEPAAARAVAAEILGMAMLAAGDLSAALLHLPDDASSLAANSFHVANSFHRFHLLRAQALARSGDGHAADRALQTARAHSHPAYVYVGSSESLTEAWVAAVQMRVSEARQLARTAAAYARGHDQLAREVWCLQTAVQFDDTEAADRLAELALLVDGPRAAVAARYAAAVAADDADELDRTAAEFEHMGDLLTAADAAGQAATSHRRSGRVGSAMTAAASSRRLAAACGGATSPAMVAASFTPPFSSREREIAVLVAQGLTNRQIAESVSLSVRTVESHVYRASNKAGVNGRAGLAAMMRGTEA
ncbi:LuxR family transcriptional regulator [Mycobacterium hodleri]|uniref:helix-turn-helix transcriptional regulator n=1 Tax=Mycolicibacterium hodleri TaxID=49897 RepID=UPI0021F39EF7|nr:LuxR family transcriptional regulator [Mycolicibacterium hodleri]MCV7133283.1 LuxR family transcriptional regulator [Mycolicibacterium hodleri]